MNLFSGLVERGATIQLNTQSAVMAPVVAAMLADGRVEDGELLQIHAICQTSSIFERNSRLENERLIMKMARAIEDYGAEVFYRRSAATLNPALRETAFTYAVQVNFSDGYVGLLEQEVMQDIAAALQIDPDRARTFVEVVAVMQHTPSS